LYYVYALGKAKNVLVVCPIWAYIHVDMR